MAVTSTGLHIVTRCNHYIVTSSGGMCSKSCSANNDCPEATAYSWYCEVTGSVCKPDKKL